MLTFLAKLYSSPVTQVGSISRMDADARRRQILKHAVRAFVDKPYGEVSTAEIAAAAGVARPLIHHYFGTKRELYLECVRSILSFPVALLTPLLANGLEERITVLTEHWITVAARYPEMWVAIVRLGAQGGDHEVLEIIRQADREAAAAVIAALDLTLTPTQETRLEAALVSCGAMVKEWFRQWLEEGTLEVDDLRALAVPVVASVIETCLSRP